MFRKGMEIEERRGRGEGGQGRGERGRGREEGGKGREGNTLILKSSGESVEREGDKLTSNSQALRFSSKSTSNPYNSKQFCLF